MCLKALQYPGVKRVEHVFLYAVAAVASATRHAYFDRAHRRGVEFAEA